jgi:hypothetical protein
MFLFHTSKLLKVENLHNYIIYRIYMFLFYIFYTSKGRKFT